MNNKKGISLMIMVITIVIMVIIAGAVFLTLNNQKLDEKANLAVLQSDMQTMLDGYEVKYNELLVKYKGDVTKFNSEDIQELQTAIPDKYKDEYVATSVGIKYIGIDEEEKDIAVKMGMFTNDSIVEVASLDVETTTHTADINVNFKDESAFELVSEYKYYVKKADDNNWVLKEVSDSPTVSITKLLYGKYQLKLEVITDDDSSVEYISPKEFELKPIQVGSLKFTYDTKTGTEYTVETWSNKSIYCSLTQGNANTTYEIEGILNTTKEDYLIEKEGTFTAVVNTDDKTNSGKKEYVVNIDKTFPTLSTMEVIAPENGIYKAGQTIIIKTTFSENIYGTQGNIHRDVITSENAPTLQIRFGEGEVKNAQFHTATNNSISYKYTIETSDNGSLVVDDYTGKVYDIASNATNVEKIELTGKNIIADNEGPNCSNVEVKNITTEGYEVHVYGVKDAYSDVDRVQFPTWTINAADNNQDDIQADWPVSTKAKGVLQSDGTTWIYTVKRTDHKNEFGKYITHIYLYDELGNSTTVVLDDYVYVPGTVTFNQSPVSSNPTSKVIYNGNEYGTLPELTRLGYNFVGWYKDEALTTQVTESTQVTDVLNHTLYQKWTPKTDTKYTVIHQQMNLDGTTYTEVEKEELTGTTDTKVTPGVKTYEGFTSPETQTVNINGDGSTTVTYKYIRNKYNFVLGEGTGVSTSGSTTSGSYYYGTTITLKATVNTGYTWSKWISNNEEVVASKADIQTTFAMPAENVKMTPSVTANKYTVKYDGNGSTGGSTASSTHTYDKEQELTANGYVRSYKVTYNHNYTGSTNVEKTGTYAFNGWATTSNGAKVYNNGQKVTNLVSTNGATVTLYAVWTGGNVTYVPERLGYEFGGWYKNAECTSVATDATGVYTPTETITLYAKWIAKEVGYKVEHQQMSIDGEYETIETENPKALAGTSVTPEPKTYTGFTTPAKQTVTIAADGSTVIVYKYERNKYIFTLGSAAGVSTSGSSTSGEYYYGATITLKASATAGYTFGSWTSSNTNLVANPTAANATFIMPAGAITMTPSASVVTYTISYNLNGGALATGKTNPTTYTVTSGDIVLNNPTKTGYTFKGWTGSNGTTAQTTVKITAGSTGNKSYTAVWEAAPVGYTVIHQQMGLDGKTYTTTDTQNLTANTGSSVTPDTITYTGFTAPSKQTVTIAADGSTTVTYKYTRNQHDVVVKAGTGIASVTGAGTYYYGASVTINATVSAGYTWSKWTGTHNVTTQSYTFTMPDAEVGDTANATANTYTVAYNGNGATGGSTASSSHTYGVAKALTSNGYTRAYTVTYNYNGATGGNSTASATATYTFSKWNTAAGGTGTAYTNGQTVTNLATSGTVTLYAQWTSASVTLPTPTKTGYTFAGWYSNSALTASAGAAGASYTPASNITLYAKWTPNTYTVTYYNGTTKLGTSSHTYGTESALKTWATLGGTVSNSSVGWGFYGWSISNANTTRTYTNGQNVSTLTSTNGGNVNVYAVYSRTITFKHGSSSATSSTATQLWNPYGSTNGTHLSDVTSPTLTAISGWTAGGFRNDTTAGASEYSQNSTIYPASGEAATLYGIYSKTVTATYYYYNGTAYTNTKSTATVYYNSYGNTLGGTPTAPTVSNPSGWSPRGWSTSSAATATVATPGAITANTTYYYSWSKTVTATKYVYNNTSSTATGTAYLNYAGTTTNASINLGTTSLTGYGFRGWSTSNAANATVSVAANGNASIATNTTYYASYTYTVTATYYYYNGTAYTNTKPTATAYMNYVGTKVGGTPTAPTVSNPSGWSPRGWSTSSAATATVATPGAITANTTYYYSWSKTVTVSYDMNGGTGTISSQSGTSYLNYAGADTGVVNTISTSEPTRENYVFTGWNSATDGSGKDYSGGTAYTFSASTTLYAQWVEAVAKITNSSNVTTYYKTVNEAVAAAGYYQKVDLLKTTTISSPITVSSDKSLITLNLNTYNISCDTAINCFNVQGGLVVEGTGTISNTKGNIFYVTGNLWINGGNYSAIGGNVVNSSGYTYISGNNTKLTGPYTTPTIANSGSLEIVGGTITATYYANTIQSTGGTVTITGGTITNSVAYGVDSVYRTIYLENTTATIGAATITSTNNIAIHSLNSNITVNSGANITGDYRAINKNNGGTLTVNSGANITVECSSYLSNNATFGAIAILSSSTDSGSIYLKGGKIYALAKSGSSIAGVTLNNASSTLYLGVDDSTLSTTDPDIMGYSSAIVRNSTDSKIYWYDGRMARITASTSSLTSFCNSTTNLTYKSTLTPTYGTGTLASINGTEYTGSYVYLKNRY